jgi:hypothetical protein
MQLFLLLLWCPATVHTLVFFSYHVYFYTFWLAFHIFLFRLPFIYRSVFCFTPNLVRKYQT